ncbi:MAG: hypothetical protein L6Q97_25820, partial [Thermoanaerobaculia bacterium]|nr:hypothetical protein [Thermoanaerobaculia bacterium]
FTGKGKKTLKVPETFSPAEYLNWAILYWGEKMSKDEHYFAEYDDQRPPAEIKKINNIFRELYDQMP